MSEFALGLDEVRAFFIAESNFAHNPPLAYQALPLCVRPTRSDVAPQQIAHLPPRSELSGVEERNTVRL
jgi:hypothetical protein